ncbi:MAG: divergent polysaccharide deacetylase family protein [Candidatus Omnitrophota bacterium]|jgi:polysaccharide deacetylase 2 family uncharacterized protein YibQ
MRNTSKKYLIVIILITIITLIILILALKKSTLRIHKISVPFKGKIAIVIDDWGYNLNNIPIAEGIKYPFTASVLPNLKSSKEAAYRLHSAGFEVILHLPMEPKEKYGLEKNTITVSTDKESINKIISEDLSNIVYAKGISNHMGSRATEDSRIMTLVFKELKNRHLYFLDSFVTPRSVCREVAGKIGIPSAKRDIFLDNKVEKTYIRQQINKLKSCSRRKGWAVGIGHDRKVTLETLKEEMPALTKEGYRLVFVSELVN